jgi:hypothetical protein
VANWRSFVARRVLGRVGIERDVLSTATQWLWPYWAERQLDPESPAFVPRGPLPFLANITARNWTVVGNLASPWSALVDPRGLVTPWRGGWSLDWWIGAEDRWHFPSREAAVRQSLASSVPVVETAMRVPGGDVVQRVYALPTSAASPASGSPEGVAQVVVVEVENQSPVPVAVAFSIRPYNPEGLSAVGNVELEETTVLVDGRPALWLPRPPSGVAGSTLSSGDSAHRVMAHRAVTGPLDLEDPDGLAQAAFVYPLPHRGTLRVAMPLTHDGRARRGGPVLRRAVAPTALDAARLPSGADAARGWQAQLRRGVRLSLPDARLQAAVDANRGYLLLFHTGQGITPAPWAGDGVPSGEAASMVVTLDRFGFHAEAAEVLRATAWRSAGGDSAPLRQPASHAGTLWAIAEHHRLTGDAALLGDVVPLVRAGIRALAGESATGLQPYEQAFWRLRGLVDGAWLLRLTGDGVGADAADAAAGKRRDAITASLEEAAAALERLAMPAGPNRGFDAGMVRSLVACATLGLLPPEDPWVAGTLEVVRERFCLGDALYDPVLSGLSPVATLLLAGCELAAGAPVAWRRLRWVLDAATTTFTWPEAVHPRLGGGCGGDGHHGGVAAAFLGFIRQVLVRETAGGGLALASIFPPEWAGQPVEVHDAPTHYGRISYALRWHGDRPALLWQCERPGVTLSVPGLDRSFSTTEPAGEVLLAPYRARIPVPVEDASDR